MIATKGLKAKGFFRNLRISGKEKKKGGMADEKKTLLLRAPLGAIGAQKCIIHFVFKVTCAK